MSPREDTQPPTIQVIGRMFALLDELAQHAQAVPLKVLAERTGLHPSTAHRILNDLAWGGLVERPSAGHYGLGPRFVSLGNLSRARLNLTRAAVGPMKQLSQKTQCSVGLWALRAGALVCLHQISPHGMPQPDTATTTLADLGSAGLALLAACSGATHEEAHSTAPSPMPASSATATSIHLTSVIRDDGGQVIAVLSLTHLTPTDGSQAGQPLDATARTISRGLGWIDHSG